MIENHVRHTRDQICPFSQRCTVPFFLSLSGLLDAFGQVLMVRLRYLRKDLSLKRVFDGNIPFFFPKPTCYIHGVCLHHDSKGNSLQRLKVLSKAGNHRERRLKSPFNFIFPCVLATKGSRSPAKIFSHVRREAEKTNAASSSLYFTSTT